MLKAEGIEVFLYGEGTITALVSPGGEIKLMVPHAQLDRARQVLADLERPEDGEE